jgi:hypothetical protein
MKLWAAISLAALMAMATSPALQAQNTNSADIRGVATDPHHRNNVYGPGLTIFDLSMGKTFNAYKELYKFQLRVEAINALNHPSFPQTGAAIGSGGPCTITGTTVGGRILQLGGLFSF